MIFKGGSIKVPKVYIYSNFSILLSFKDKVSHPRGLFDREDDIGFYEFG